MSTTVPLEVGDYGKPSTGIIPDIYKETKTDMIPTQKLTEKLQETLTPEKSKNIGSCSPIERSRMLFRPLSGNVRKRMVYSLVTVVTLVLVVFIGVKYIRVVYPRPTTSGFLWHDEVWSGEVYVTGDITVPVGITLTITPGTRIYVNANHDDRGSGGEHIADELTNIDPSATNEYTSSHIRFTIQGTLNAIGEPGNMILFTSDSDSPSHTDWDGMTFVGGSKGELRHVVVEWTHTGPAIHGTDDVTVSHSIIRHVFWGGLHAFQCSPLFEYNVLDDIGHEGFDTHKASPTIRHNEISHARVGFVFNYYDLSTEEPLLFENNIVRDCSTIGQLQENPYAIIRNNRFIGSDDTGGPWHYKGFTLDSNPHTGGLALADNVNVEIANNNFIDIEGPSIRYEKIGPNKGIGHTTNVPEPYEITGPTKILVKDNYFNKISDMAFLEELLAWDNVELINNRFE